MRLRSPQLRQTDLSGPPPWIGARQMIDGAVLCPDPATAAGLLDAVLKLEWSGVTITSRWAWHRYT
jgi:hypothetical protein